MSLSVGNNLIAKPVLPLRGDSAKIPNFQTSKNSSYAEAGQIVVESNQAQTPAPAVNVFGGSGLVENNLLGQVVEPNSTEVIAEVLDPSEILDWTDDVPPMETELQEIPLDMNEKVESIDSDPDGTDDQDAKDGENQSDELESPENEQEYKE